MSSACDFCDSEATSFSIHANNSDESKKTDKYDNVPSQDIDGPCLSRSTDESEMTRTSPVIPANLVDTPFSSSENVETTKVATFGSVRATLNVRPSLEDSPRTSDEDEHKLNPSGNSDVPSLDDEHQKQTLDLVHNIKGLYRILDLIPERGSGGLIDKIIIDQVSTTCLVNELRPGSCKNLAKVDFNALDEVLVKPLGIYGSKSEIIQFLRELQVLDDHITTLLMMPQLENVSTIVASLRAGLYGLLVPATSGNARRLFVIFWPEETTWNDDAIPTVRRNRIMFMRYLTKVTDQIVSLISEEHDRTLEWQSRDNDDDDVTPSNRLKKSSDRRFACEVAKSEETKENVVFAEGVKEASMPELPAALGFSEDQLKTRLVAGNTNQALMTTACLPSSETPKTFRETYENDMQLKAGLFSTDVALHLEKGLPAEAISILIKTGLGSRYCQAVSAFEKRNEENEDKVKEERSIMDKIKKELDEDEPRLRDALETHFVKTVLELYPKLKKAILYNKDPTGLPSEDMNKANEDFLLPLSKIYPGIGIQEKVKENVQKDLTAIEPQPAKLTTAMKNVLMCHHLFEIHNFSDEDRTTIAKDLLASKADNAWSISRFLGCWSNDESSVNAKNPPGLSTDSIKKASEAVGKPTISGFSSTADVIWGAWPILQDGICMVFSLASECFAEKVAVLLRKLIEKQLQHPEQELKQNLNANLSKARLQSCFKLIADIEAVRCVEGNW